MRTVTNFPFQSRWRTPKAEAVLKKCTMTIRVVQLQGHLFFGNATLLADEIEKLVNSADRLRFVVLDFTLVVAIDSSAAETISKLYSICRKANVGLCYSRGSSDGFPCGFPLTQRLRSCEQEGVDEEVDVESTSRELLQCCSRCGATSFSANASNRKSHCLACGYQRCFYNSRRLFLSDNLDDGLAWCEDILIFEDSEEGQSSAAAIPTASVPLHLQQIHSLLEIEGESTSSLKQMMSFFVEESVSAGSVLWRQGDPSDRAVLLVMGQLRSALEDEVGTTEAVLPGHLVGEFGLLNGQSRLGTLSAQTNSQLLVLTKENLRRMRQQRPELAFLLAKICMVNI